jgi:RNase P subunit RPR2
MTTTTEQISKTPTLEDYLRTKMLKETLKYAAGQQIFCRGCSTILDWKTTVVINAKNDKGSSLVIICTDCFKPEGVEELEKNGFTVEIDKL